MPTRRLSLTTVSTLAIVTLCTHPAAADADSAQIARDKYLVQIAGCTDCHTPGNLIRRPDLSRYLGGFDIGFEMPGLGTFVPPNLTPDKATGLGTWTKEEMITAIRTGVRPDGRILAPIMPWHAYAGLTKADVGAIVDYLRSIPPVSHKVPGPFGPTRKVPISHMSVLPPDVAEQ
jgi:mono/diheme cytochrome c family protein